MFKLWSGNGSCVEGIWIGFKEKIFDGIKRHVPKKTPSKNLDPE
jgi:hypothetical protein